MIEKIDKYLFLVYHQDYDSFLLKLRDLGVVHIKENKPTSVVICQTSSAHSLASALRSSPSALPASPLAQRRARHSYSRSRRS